MRSVWTRRLGLVGLALHVSALLACAQDKGGTATQPVPREGPWMQLHERYLERAKQGEIDLLFLGDSITQGWNNNATWKRFFDPRRAANFGIGGDRTQHVLWRLEHGEIDGIRPKVVVLMIGTNNVGGNSTDEIAAGIEAIVQRLRDKLPESKVLLLGVFPRGASRPKDQTAVAPDPRISEINDKISRLDDGKMIKYLDIGKHFLTTDGQVPKDLMPDFLHLSSRGYRTWAEAIEPVLWDLMDAR